MNIIKSDIVDRKYDALWNDEQASEGMDQRPVLVIVSDCEKGSAADAQLQKMLGGAKLNAGQYNVIRIKADELVAWHKLRDKLDPKIVFLVGVRPAQLGISALFTINAANNFNDRYWLPASSLAELAASTDLKLQLWNNGMKPLLQDKVFVIF